MFSILLYSMFLFPGINTSSSNERINVSPMMHSESKSNEFKNPSVYLCNLSFKGSDSVIILMAHHKLRPLADVILVA